MLLGDHTGSCDKCALRRRAGGAGFRDLGWERGPDNLPAGRDSTGLSRGFRGQWSPSAQLPGK